MIKLADSDICPFTYSDILCLIQYRIYSIYIERGYVVCRIQAGIYMYMYVQDFAGVIFPPRFLVLLRMLK